MIATILDKLVNFYEFLIIVYCLLSWFPRGRGGFIDDLSAVLVSQYLQAFYSGDGRN